MSNITSYFFGQLTDGFDSTVRDHTKVFFQRVTEYAAKDALLCVKREGQLMYYAHSVPLISGGRFGVCIALNGLAFSRFSRLFACLQDFVAQLVIRGEIIGLNRRGELVAQVSNFVQAHAAVEVALARLQYEIDGLHDFIQLPQLDYSEGCGEELNINLSNTGEDEVFRYTVGGHTVFLQDPGQADVHLRSTYRDNLIELYSEKNDIGNELSQLKTDFAHLERQKKSLTLVAGLLLLLFIGGGIAIAYQNSLKKDIEQREGEIDHLNGDVRELSSQNDSMSSTMDEQRNTIEILQNELHWKRDSIEKLVQERDSLVLQNQEYSSIIEEFIANQEDE